MLKKTIKFTNFNDEEVEETFYFNLTKSELLTYRIEKGEGFEEYVRKIQATNDQKSIFNTFKEIVQMTIGLKSSDGGSFIKSPEITANFMNSAAYDVFFMELFTDPKAGPAFINGVLPKGLITEADIEKYNNSSVIKLEDRDVKELTNVIDKRIKEYTPEELLSMSDADFDAVAGKDPSAMEKSILVIAMQRKTRAK